MINPMPNKEALKQAIISILIGATIAFITTLLQGLLGYFQHINIEPSGGFAGVIYYLVRVIKYHSPLA